MAHSRRNLKETPHFSYIWTIENMSVPCFVESPKFTSKQMEMTEWYLQITSDNSDILELSIHRLHEDDGPKAIEINFELSFLGIDGLPLIEDIGFKKFKNNDCVEFQLFADKNEVLLYRRAEFLPKDALTIRCRMWRTGTEISQNDSCFARTILTPNRHCFVWAIRDFISLPRDHERKILLGGWPAYKLTLNLNVTENDGEEYISISTKDCDADSIVFKICLLDFEGKVVHAQEKSGNSQGVIQFENFFEKRKLMDDTSSLLLNDVLLLRCEIELLAKYVSSKIETYTYLN